jgi:hypothetical protein
MPTTIKVATTDIATAFDKATPLFLSFCFLRDRIGLPCDCHPIEALLCILSANGFAAGRSERQLIEPQLLSQNHRPSEANAGQCAETFEAFNRRQKLK